MASKNAGKGCKTKKGVREFGVIRQRCGKMSSDNEQRRHDFLSCGFIGWRILTHRDRGIRKQKNCSPVSEKSKKSQGYYVHCRRNVNRSGELKKKFAYRQLLISREKFLPYYIYIYKAILQLGRYCIVYYIII